MSDPVKRGKRAIDTGPPSPPDPKEMCIAAFHRINPPITTKEQVGELVHAMWWCAHAEGDEKWQLETFALLTGMACATLVDYAKLLEGKEAAKSTIESLVLRSRKLSEDRARDRARLARPRNSR